MSPMYVLVHTYDHSNNNKFDARLLRLEIWGRHLLRISALRDVCIPRRRGFLGLKSGWRDR